MFDRPIFLSKSRHHLYVRTDCLNSITIFKKEGLYHEYNKK